MAKVRIKMPARIWCNQHKRRVCGGNRVHEHKIAIALIQALVTSDEFENLCEDIYDEQLVNETLSDMSPLCCYLGDDTIYSVFLDCINAKGEA